MIIRFFWRFFTGAHLDGLKRKHRGGPVKPMFSDIYWNRISRRKRALWRNGLFFGSALTVYGLLAERSLTLYFFAAMIPFIIARMVQLAFSKFTMVTKAVSSDGIAEEYRVLRPKYAKMLRSIKPRKFRVSVPGSNASLRDATVNESRIVTASNAEDGLEPITRLQLAQGENDVTDTPLKGRARTIARKNRKAAS